MKNKLKETIPIFVIIYCLIVVPAILYKYNIYLSKPDNNTWSQVEKYLINSKKYNKEPIVFSPNWLKNYATDLDRFQKLNIAKSANSFNSYWLISMDKKTPPKDYQIIVAEKIENLFIFKLKK